MKNGTQTLFLSNDKNSLNWFTESNFAELVKKNCLKCIAPIQYIASYSHCKYILRIYSTPPSLDNTFMFLNEIFVAKMYWGGSFACEYVLHKSTENDMSPLSKVWFMTCIAT